MKKLLISGGDGKFAREIIKQNKEFYIIAPTRQEKGYSCVEDSVSSKVSDDVGSATYQSFPEEYRIDNFINLIFERSEES